MFSRLWRWLKSLSGKRGGFSDRERAIFEYWDGSKWQWADPFQIQRDLEQHGGKGWTDYLSGLSVGGGVELDKMSPSIRQAVVDNFHFAVKTIAELVRKVFHVSFLRSLDGKPVGLSDAECVDLLADYLDFVSKLENEFRPLLLPPMAADQPSAEDSITGPCAESPLDENAYDGTEPKMWPEELRLPSEESAAGV